ncbi:TetR/AcrR family transcriptional regulator [Prauserella cavernicola]|uniref:TetR family transcriptional regulator n=1 Tax=Prauserella cavernicola TaxID=2800127 RepID=A0A934QNS5_9PSEU|nr:TetR/AcrR family transcriptional regulator [Prauserella cavernicola]MBK1785452.1 TetR family transcriptional regulator [Prauserella cavernicola]
MAVATGERVRRAAVKLFATKGFHGTGIRDLAQAAKLSSASLYHYMGTKEELLAGIMRDCLRNLLDEATTALEGVSDPVERVRRLVTVHVTAHARQPNETRVADDNIEVLSPRLRRDVVRLRDDYEALWSDTIEEGLREGVFDTAQPTVTRIAVLDMCTGVARWYSSRGPLSLRLLAEHHVELTLRALGVRVSAGCGLANSRDPQACPGAAAEGRSWGE